MIQIKNLNKNFGNRKVLKNFNATFDVGATCVMGVSGVGKTTLINIMLGLTKEDSGEIIGLENKKVVCVFQEDRLLEDLTVLKNIMLVCGREQVDKVRTLLKSLHLTSHINRPVHTLSGGMKRRVAIARALIKNADVYIFDEPFKGLDNDLKEHVINVIKSQTKSAVSIFITHNFSDIKLLNAKTIKITGVES